MTYSTVAFLLIAVLFGSAISIQILMFPRLIARIADRSTVTRVANEVLKGHHTLALVFLIVAAILFLLAGGLLPAAVTLSLLFLNLYQRLWLFTKLHIVKQPIGVQDLIQPDNTLREESNRLQTRLYLL